MRGLLCIFICLCPVFSGFFVPVLVLISNIDFFLDANELLEILLILKNTVLVCFFGAFCIVITATFLASATFVIDGKFFRIIANLASTGYAFPGTMLAIGVMISAGALDDTMSYISSVNYVSLDSFHFSGTLGLLVFAYLVRYLAVGYGAAVSGSSRISPNLNWASRTLSKKISNTILKISIPLLKKSIIAGGLLAFVDIAKELPMTLLLRPFNFETLATYTYQYAHDELMGQAALPALIIILFGLIPVIFLNKLLRD